MAGPKTSSSAAKHAHATQTTAGASKRANAQTVASSSASPPAAASASKAALDTLWNAYLNTTPSRLKFIDAFLVFLVLSGVVQFVYCVLVTSFPFNAFLAGCVLARLAWLNIFHCD
jgi:DAD family